MDCIVHGVAKSWTRLSDFHFHFHFPGGSEGKESAFSAGDLGSIPGSRRSPGEGNCCPLQYSRIHGIGNWWATVHGVSKSQMIEQLTVSLFFFFAIFKFLLIFSRSSFLLLSEYKLVFYKLLFLIFLLLITVVPGTLRIKTEIQMLKVKQERRELRPL